MHDSTTKQGSITGLLFWWEKLWILTNQNSVFDRKNGIMSRNDEWRPSILAKHVCVSETTICSEGILWKHDIVSK